jgi:hypothetical protein
MAKTFARFLIQRIGKPMSQLDDHPRSHRIVYTLIHEAIEWNIIHRGERRL